LTYTSHLTVMLDDHIAVLKF